MYSTGGTYIDILRVTAFSTGSAALKSSQTKEAAITVSRQDTNFSNSSRSGDIEIRTFDLLISFPFTMFFHQDLKPNLRAEMSKAT